MVARLQQFATFSLLGIAIVWAIGFWRAGQPLFALGGAMLILGGYALFLALEFLLLASVHGNDPTPRATPRQLFKAWLGEVTTAPRVFCWRQPFFSGTEHDHVPTRPSMSSRQPGVVLVHGLLCNRALWNPWMRELRARGITFIAVNLEPIFGSIDDYLDQVEAAVQRIEFATGVPPVLVAHSMGGLVVRAWLNTQRSDQRVRRIVTIATPHRGTWLARFGRTRNGVEMRIDSPWLTALADGEASKQRHSRFTCFYSHCDNIVFPASTATLPGADNRHLPGTAHVHMAFQAPVFEEILRWLGPQPQR